MSSTTLTFSSLSSLHEHLRGSQIVRLAKMDNQEMTLVIIPSGQGHNQCRLVRITYPIGNEKEINFATSEPTEFSEWF